MLTALAAPTRVLQDFRPRIHITNSDFASITQNGALCDVNGHLGPDEFADVIRRQVTTLTRESFAGLYVKTWAGWRRVGWEVLGKGAMG